MAPTELADLFDLLADVAEYLDNRADVEDGDDGQPRPNRAMRLHQRVQEAIARMPAPEVPR